MKIDVTCNCNLKKAAELIKNGYIQYFTDSEKKRVR